MRPSAKIQSLSDRNIFKQRLRKKMFSYLVCFIHFFVVVDFKIFFFFFGIVMKGKKLIL